MATTTAFGWETPDDTDLVKDGAAAIRTLGSSIDTSMADLKGGTTGQVLTKATNTDMDFTWVAQDDANAIQNTQLTAKGALITAFSSATPATLTVGTNGQVLTADSTTATGLAWTTDNGPAFRAFRDTSNQSFSASTFTKVQFNAEDFDTASCFDSTTNYRFTPTKAGYYQFNSNLSVNGTGEFAMQIRKNGTSVNQGANDNISALGYLGASVSSLFYMNGSTDYVEVFVFVAGGSPFLYNGATGAQTAFSGVWIRS
jgi:hypothetical protein